MTTRAKLFVSAIHRQAGSPDAVEVEFGAATQGEENRSWAEATPQAQFRMTIQNPVAAAEFKRLGQEFYVTFKAAETLRPTLADCEGFVMPGYYAKQIEDGQFADVAAVFARHNHVRCERCNCKPQSHEEPLRSEVIAALGLA